MADLRHGRYWFDGWSMPDPEDETRREALHTARYDLDNLTQHQAYLICEMAEAYIHLAAHPATNKSIIDQLRKLRRAVKHA